MTEPLPLPPAVRDAIAAAEHIPGWMADEELDWLARRVVGASFVAEVGCYTGKTTSVLLAALPPAARLLAVDTWVGEADVPTRVGVVLEAEFIARFAPALTAHRLVLFEVPSVDAAACWPDGAFDLVFIDADHRYEAVRDDLTAWEPKVRPGGVLAGHDWYQEGVERALTERYGRNGWQHGPRHIWFREVPGAD